MTRFLGLVALLLPRIVISDLFSQMDIVRVGNSFYSTETIQNFEGTPIYLTFDTKGNILMLMLERAGLWGDHEATLYIVKKDTWRMSVAPFYELQDTVTGVAVDHISSYIYISTTSGLYCGNITHFWPVTEDLDPLMGVAVDNYGTVYVIRNSRVFKLLNDSSLEKFDFANNSDENIFYLTFDRQNDIYYKSILAFDYKGGNKKSNLSQVMFKHITFLRGNKYLKINKSKLFLGEIVEIELPGTPLCVAADKDDNFAVGFNNKLIYYTKLTDSEGDVKLQ